MRPSCAGSSTGRGAPVPGLPSPLLHPSRFYSLHEPTPFRKPGRFRQRFGARPSSATARRRRELLCGAAEPRAPPRPASLQNRRGQGESGDPRRFRTQAGSDSSREELREDGRPGASRSSSTRGHLVGGAPSSPTRKPRSSTRRRPLRPPGVFVLRPVAVGVLHRNAVSGHRASTPHARSSPARRQTRLARTRALLALSLRSSPAWGPERSSGGLGNRPRQPSAVTCACSARPLLRMLRSPGIGSVLSSKLTSGRP